MSLPSIHRDSITDSMKILTGIYRQITLAML
jgi:hypothetical protein